MKQIFLNQNNKPAYRNIKTLLLTFVFSLAYVVFSFGLNGITQTEAAIPKYINFQGKLTKVSDGTNMANGTYAFEFKLYTLATGGSLVWTETYDQASGSCGKLAVTNGVFNAKLGTCNSLAAVDFTTGSLFLSVNFAPTGTSYDGEMSPRKQLLSSAFAFVANSVVGDGKIDIANTGSNQATIGYDSTNKLQVNVSSGGLTTLTANGAAAGINLMGGNIGIGDATPTALLTVGSGDLFQVNSSGAIAAATGITSSGTITFSGLSTAGVVTNNSSGVLSTDTALDVATGGTNISSYTAGDLLYASGSTTLVKLGIGTTDYIMTSTGSAPQWVSALTDAQVSNTLTSSIFVGSGSTTNAIDLGTAEVAGTLGVANGGTGAATFTSNGVLYGNGTSAIQATSQGGANTVLVANSGTPSFSSAITVGTSVTSPTINATTAFQLNGTNINTAGTLSNVAYLDQANVFSANQTITKADPSLVLNVTTATDTDFWLGVQDDAGGDDDDVFQIGDGTTAGTNPFLTVNTSGNVGIGDTSPAALLTVGSGDLFQISSAGAVSATTTMQAATGNEVAYQFNYTTNKATSGNDTGVLINMTDSASPGTSNILDVQLGGTSQFRVANNGIVATTQLTASGGVAIAATQDLSWTSRSRITAPASGQLLLQNSGGTDFSLLQFGGTTSSFPALKRSTTTLQARLADDSGYASLDAGNYLLSGTNINTAGTLSNVAYLNQANTFSLNNTFSTSVTTPLITATGALALTPAAGSNLNINLSTTGDLAVNTNQLYVDTSTGNVGLGNSSPDARLSFGGLVNSPSIFLYDGAGAGENYGMGMRDFEIQQFLPSSAHFSFNAGGDLQVSGTNELMRIQGNGNVGIGDTSPAALLTVGSGDLFQVASNGNLTSSNAGTWTFSNDTNIALSGGVNGISFDTDVLSIDATNNRVGIGTTAPLTKLDFGTSVVNAGQIINIYSSNNIRSGIGMDSLSSGLRLYGSSGQANGSPLTSFGMISDSDGSTYTELMRLDRTGNFGIGDTSPAAMLTVGSDASAGFANGSGDAYVQNDLEVDGAMYLASTTSSAGILFQGSNRLLHTYGTDNLFLGKSAGNFTLSGTNNTSLGRVTMGALTSGSSNVAVGDASLFAATTGSSNVGVGLSALEALTTGGSNVAVGQQALATITTTSNNTALGFQALYGTSSSAANSVALGYRAGFAVTSGVNNIMLGYQAGNNITSGSNNIVIGYDIDAPSATASNQLNIGDVIYGDLSTALIGIGTSSPSEKLDVSGAVTAGSILSRGYLTAINNRKAYYAFDGSTISTTEWAKSATGVTQNEKLLFASGDATWTQGLASEATFPRSQALVFEADVKLTSLSYFVLGWKNNNTTIGSYTNFHHGLYFLADGTIVSSEDSVFSSTLSTYSLNTQYRIKIVLKTGGGASYYISSNAGRTWTTLSSGDTDPTNSPVRLGMSFYGGGAEVDNVEVYSTSGTDTLYANAGNIVEVSGNVGIGDTSPAALLTVGSGDLFQVASNGNLTSSNAGTWTFSNDTNIVLSGGVNGMSFDTDVLSIDATNNRVGIGTTVPSSNLDVYGADATIRISNTDSATGAAKLLFDTTCCTGDGMISVTGDGGNAYMHFYTSSGGLQEYMTIAAGGNVGIGDTSPAALLTVGSGDLFQVNSSGAITASTGVASSGLIQGTLGLTITGAAASLNASSNFATNINTGTSNGAVTIGGGSGTVAVNSTSWDISTAGVATGFTGITSTGTIQGGTLYATAGDASGAYNNASIGLGYQGTTNYSHFIHTRHDSNSGTAGAIDFYLNDGTASGTFPTNGVIGMSLKKSTGLGIGITDAVNKLDVEGAAVIGASYSGTETAPSNGLLVQGNVGIGDTSPAALLTVGSGDLFQVASNGNLTSSNAGTWTFSNDTNIALSGGVNGISFDTDVLSIDATNNRVGIGTTAPVSQLDIGGGNVTRDLMAFTVSGFPSSPYIAAFKYDTAITNAPLVLNMSNDGTASGFLRAFSVINGNMGIGDTTPASLFTVGSGDLFQVASNGNLTSSNAGTWTFSNDTNIALSGGVNGISFDTDVLSIDATNDRVGIGITAPSSKLHVVVNDATTNSTTDLLQLAHTTSGTAANNIGTGILFQTEDTNGDTEDSGRISSLLTNASHGSESGSLLFSTRSIGVGVTEKMRLGTFGELGINTTASSAQLQISNTVAMGAGTSSGIQLTSTANIGGNDFRGLNIDRNTGTASTAYGIYAAISGSSTNVGALLQTENTATATVSDILRLRSLTSGTAANNIGTGILLQAEDTNGDSEDAGRVSAILTNATHGAETSALLFSTRSSAGALTEAMRIQGNGNVGIGTSSSLNQKLNVAGSIALTTGGSVYGDTTDQQLLLSSGGGTKLQYNSSNYINISSNITMSSPVSGATSGLNLYSDYGGGVAGRSITLQAYNGSVFRTGLSYANVSSGEPNLILVQSAGNVGIGDTTPAALLTVGSGDLFQVASNGNLTSSNAGTWTFSNDTNIVLSGGVNGLSFDTNVLSIDATNDKVGIGTTSPGQKLTVAGDISATNNAAYFSTDNMALGQIQGGALFGRTTLTENQWQLSSYTPSTWTDRTTAGYNFYSVSLSSDGKYAMAPGYGNQILTSSDYGNSWTARDSVRNWLRGAMSSDGKFQAATADSGQVYTSSDYGVTWTARDSNRSWIDVAMSSDGKYMTATVASGQIYTSSDYGVTWTARDSNRSWYFVAMSSDGKLQTALVYGGQIYTSSDYGVTWTARDSSRNWWNIAMSADGKLQTAVVDSGQIYTSSDYGVTWTARDSSRGWQDVAMTADGRVQLAAVYNSTLYISTDYGVTWTSTGPSTLWRTVGMSSDGKVMMAGGSSVGINVAYNESSVNGSVIIASRDYGSGTAGPVLTLGRNTNATTGAGSINFQSKAGTAGYVWQDNAGNMRIHTAAPSNANDTSGTVIGTQTSTRDTKQNISDYTDYAAALQMVADAPLHTFKYIRDVQGYGPDSELAKTRIGYIADEVPAEFMWGNAIDQVSVNGILMASIKALNQNIEVASNDLSKLTSKITVKNGKTGINNINPDATFEVTGGLCVSDSSSDSCTVDAGDIKADGAITANAFDLAERYASVNKLEPGTVVSIDAAKSMYVTESNGTAPAMGIISTDPGFTLGWEDNKVFKNAPHVAVVALAGRVPVKVTNENGEIKAGDFLTASATVPGAAMKATKAGSVLGQALENYNNTGTGSITVFVKATNYEGVKIEDQMEGLVFDYSDPEIVTENSVAILERLLSQLADLDGQNLSQINTDVVVVNGEVITPFVTAGTVRVDSLTSATATGGLAIESSTMFNGGLRVDSISSITGLLSFNDDVEFFGTPYFTSDTAGFAVIAPGAQSVEVVFSREYLVQPIVNASISFEQEVDLSQITDDGVRRALELAAVGEAQSFLTNGISYVITNKSNYGFTIVLNKPAPSQVKFSWTAFAVRNATTFMSLEPSSNTTGNVAGDSTPPSEFVEPEAASTPSPESTQAPESIEQSESENTEAANSPIALPASENPPS
jgi:hypothetical protein